MSYKTYENYKNSGLKWIGQVPTHWETHRVKDFLSFKIGGTPSTSNESYFEGENIWVSISDLNNNKGEFISDSSIKISDEAIRASNVKLISKGSLLYSFKLSVGLTAFAGCELYTNEAIACFEPNEYIDLIFLKYIFKVGFENNAVENIYGAKLFNTDLIKFAKFVMPKDINEQRKIACFLDKKNSLINENINSNKELISLLEEKKVALINQCVTKGLDSNVPMKDSEIDWFGYVPSHWSLCKIKNNIDYFLNGAWGSEENHDKNDIVCVRIADFDYEKLSLKSDDFTVRNIVINDKRLLLEKGDLLIEKSGGGEKVPVGRVVMFNEDFEAVSSNFISKIKINEKSYSRYFLYLFNFLYSSKVNTRSIKQTTGIQNLDSYSYFNENIYIPKFDEQVLISEYLDKETSKIDRTIEKIQENIDLLVEYKESLIYHVVTGKIDVRDEV